MLVERLKVWCMNQHFNVIDSASSQEPATSLHRSALETLRTLIRTSTSSMTSVPKPLKFLRPHYPDFQVLHEQWPASEDKVVSTLHLSAF